MLLFKNEYPANTSNRWKESSDIFAAGAAFGASDGSRFRFVVTLAGAGVPTASGAETVAVVVPDTVWAFAGITDIAKRPINMNDETVPSFFIFTVLPS